MKSLRSRLSKVGIKRKFLNRVVLPSWWDDSLASSEAGFREGAGYIGAHLGLSLRILLDGSSEPVFASSDRVKFKKPKGHTKDDVDLVTNYALGVARAVAASFADKPDSAEIQEPAGLRHRLLALSDRPWVCLRHILDASWKLGIPVIQLRNLPEGAKKPDALTTMVGDRPVIVIANQRTSPSWIAFIVAHELGHLHHRHITSGQTLVDEKIDQQADEKDEGEANDFAVRLLTGHSDLGLSSTRSMGIPQLAAAAKAFGQKYRIAPGVAALNYAFTTGNWSVAIGAVGLLEKTDDASEDLKNALNAHLKARDFSEESWQWVARTTGIGE